MEILRLNASALSDPNSFHLPLTFKISDFTSPLLALVDSGSTHCFIDLKIVQQYTSALTPYSVPPIELKLIDGMSNSVITQAIMIPISFLTGETLDIVFYVTLLDSSCPLVLGYNWLTRYNLLIDWVLGSITFCSTLPNTSIPSMTSPAASSTELNSQDLPIPTSIPISTPHISFINGAAFACALRLPGVQSFSLSCSDPAISGNSASVSSDPDLSHIPEEYHDFADVFSKGKVDSLPPHHPYNLKIDLEDGAVLPIVLMYSLSQSEMGALREFIDEHVHIGFIRPSKSPHSAPILFICKEDGSLRLCVDFRGLNRSSNCQ